MACDPQNKWAYKISVWWGVCLCVGVSKTRRNGVVCLEPRFANINGGRSSRERVRMFAESLVTVGTGTTRQPMPAGPNLMVGPTLPFSIVQFSPRDFDFQFSTYFIFIFLPFCVMKKLILIFFLSSNNYWWS